jgi:5'-methylthioadenosine phosphorylase
LVLTYISNHINSFKTFLLSRFMKIGVIGGSGLDDPNLIQDYEEIEVETPFGKPSSKLTTGKISGIDVCFIARHGKEHTIPPTQINNKANIYALKEQGCTHILATTACGSLKEIIKPGEFVVLDQFIDFTSRRDVSFYEKFEPKNAKHTSMAWPFSQELRKKLAQACRDLNYKYHWRGTVITIEGARFSTIAESKMFQSLGADVINMSTAPEAILANEAEIPYGVIAMPTDYDCWRQSTEPVTWETILKVFNENAQRVKEVLVKVIESFNEDSQIKEIKDSITSIPNWPKQGITFRDITSLMQNKDAMQKTIEILYNRYKDKSIDVVAGIESRGFIFGAILAEKLNIPFIPIRKKGKLPRETISQEYKLEYGTDIIEIHKDAIKPNQKVLLVDDLLATGGTALASCKLIEQLQGKIIECTFVIELPELKGKEKLSNWPVFSVVKFEGE